MAEIMAYGSTVASVFQLIGNMGNDITKSIAWLNRKSKFQFAKETSFLAKLSST